MLFTLHSADPADKCGLCLQARAMRIICSFICMVVVTIYLQLQPNRNAVLRILANGCQPIVFNSMQTRLSYCGLSQSVPCLSWIAVYPPCSMELTPLSSVTILDCQVSPFRQIWVLIDTSLASVRRANTDNASSIEFVVRWTMNRRQHSFVCSGIDYCNTLLTAMPKVTRPSCRECWMWCQQYQQVCQWSVWHDCCTMNNFRNMFLIESHTSLAFCSFAVCTVSQSRLYLMDYCRPVANMAPRWYNAISCMGGIRSTLLVNGLLLWLEHRLGTLSPNNLLASGCTVDSLQHLLKSYLY